MSDQYDFTNGPVAWDDWLYQEELQQPFWATSGVRHEEGRASGSTSQIHTEWSAPLDPRKGAGEATLHMQAAWSATLDHTKKVGETAIESGVPPERMTFVGEAANDLHTSQPYQAWDIPWKPSQTVSLSPDLFDGPNVHDALDLQMQSISGPAFPLNVPQAENFKTGPVGEGTPTDLQHVEEMEITWRLHQRFVYMSSKCASCDAPLDSSEKMLNLESPKVYCSLTRDVDHLPLSCVECGKKYRDMKDLILHANELHRYSDVPHRVFHYSFQCAIPGCTFQVVPKRINLHFEVCHPNLQYRCAHCGTGCASAKALDEHGDQTMHASYVCQYPECGAECTRIGELKRHQLTHKVAAPRHSCPHCRKYRGDNGFKRKDHLRQHIRNYHHIDVDNNDAKSNESGIHPCRFEGCDKTGFNAFETEKLLKVHLKKDHPSPYQCSYPGCHRIGTNGWMRERDMVKHMKKDHDV